jgi:putative membrane protein
MISTISVTRFSAAWVSVFTITLVWSGINPKDLFTWILEVAPALIALILMAATYNRLQFTPLVYLLILVHCIILMVGGHYTYAEVSFFEDLFGMTRNNYDKLGHLAQGFVPAIIARALLIKLKVVNGGWCYLFCPSVLESAHSMN